MTYEVLTIHSLGLGVDSLGVYSLGVYSLGVYNLVRRDLIPETHSLGLGVYSLGVYSLGSTVWRSTIRYDEIWSWKPTHLF